MIHLRTARMSVCVQLGMRRYRVQCQYCTRERPSSRVNTQALLLEGWRTCRRCTLLKIKQHFNFLALLKLWNRWKHYNWYIGINTLHSLCPKTIPKIPNVLCQKKSCVSGNARKVLEKTQVSLSHLPASSPTLMSETWGFFSRNGRDEFLTDPTFFV